MLKSISIRCQPPASAVPSDVFLREGSLCKSLSGLAVPMLTITSRAAMPDSHLIAEDEFSKELPPPVNQRYKKYLIVTGRVHPGESNGSWMMQGFLKYITGDSLEARELRKRLVIKVIPISNPDGVSIGNYRSSLSGNDLNRQYQNPSEMLHPTVCAIKSLAGQIKQEG